MGPGRSEGELRHEHSLGQTAGRVPSRAILGRRRAQTQAPGRFKAAQLRLPGPWRRPASSPLPDFGGRPGATGNWRLRSGHRPLDRSNFARRRPWALSLSPGTGSSQGPRQAQARPAPGLARLPSWGSAQGARDSLAVAPPKPGAPGEGSPAATEHRSPLAARSPGRRSPSGRLWPSSDADFRRGRG